MPSEQYNIIVSGEHFVFTRDQLESEPGNYFATYFLGDFAEASDGARNLNLEKDPLLFKLIQAHLRGYKIFPIPDSCIPNYMTRSTAMENLLLDAQYFGLTRLEEVLKDEIAHPQVLGLKGQRIYRLQVHETDTQSDRKEFPISSESVDMMLNAGKEFMFTSCPYCQPPTDGWAVYASRQVVQKRFYNHTEHHVVEGKTI